VFDIAEPFGYRIPECLACAVARVGNLAASSHQVSGHVRLVTRKRGDQWYAKYRLPSGRQVQKRLGPAWTERSRPPAAYFTRKTAQAELEAI
jgi:hypothetical protein